MSGTSWLRSFGSGGSSPFTDQNSVGALSLWLRAPRKDAEMAKLNSPGVTASRAGLTSPVTSVTTAPDTITGNDAPGWTRDAKSELFLLSATNMVGESTFYEGASERDVRFRDLVRLVTQQDPGWVARLVSWLRGEANMRTASVVAAVEFTQVSAPNTEKLGDVVTDLRRKLRHELRHARREVQVTGLRSALEAAELEMTRTSARAVVASALQRPDEPGEAVAYAKSRGYALSGGLQRGIADAAVRLYTERAFLKYDSDARAVRFGDVLELTHPKPSAPWQGDLFAYAISKRHKRDGLAIPESLTTLRARAELEALPVDERRKLVVAASQGNEAVQARLKHAAMTWESLSGWLQGPMDKAAWETIIPEMGYMALLRNLRNFDQAGVSDAVAAQIAAKLSDPLEVAKSRQLPMRFLSAYNAAPSLRWAWALEQALTMSLENVPALKGRTLVLVDTSQSMNESFSRDGSLHRWDAAALFGIALAQRSDEAQLVSFSTTSKVFPLIDGASVLKSLERFKAGYFLNHGTSTAGTLRRHFGSYPADRVVVLTDEQADGQSHQYFGEVGVDAPVSMPYSGVGFDRSSVTDAIPQSVPMYVFNLAGYSAGSTPAGTANRHVFGGLTDAGFKLLAALEARKHAQWPF